MSSAGLMLGLGTALAQTPPQNPGPGPTPAPTPTGTPPVITSGPFITLRSNSSAPRVGDRLEASARWRGTPEPDVDWTWRRCTGQAGGCDTIRGANGVRYTLTGDDVGFVLRVRLTLRNTAGSAQAHSAFTPVVTAAASPPAPRPAPPPTPAPTPAPSPPPFELTPAPPAGGQPASPRLLTPFPTVRVKGWLTPRGARITLLTVRAPRSARIVATCQGRGCPRKTLKRKGGGVKRLRPFERELRAGTRLRFSVTRRGTIGKWTTLVIRKGAPPRRSDGCLNSNTRRRVACPT